MADIFVLGAGGWGISMAATQAKYGHNVTVWSAFENEIQMLKEKRCNANLLPGIFLPESVTITDNIKAAAQSDILVIAVPSVAVRAVVKQLKGIAENKYIVSLSKGFDEETLQRLSVVIEEELPNNRVVVLSGPSHAEEVALDIPTLCVTASKNIAEAEYIRDTFSTPYLRLYSSDDVAGVELGGAIKNIMAIAVGIIDGMNLGDNTKAALMTRGIAEMTRLGIAFGGKAETFAGLAGLGDLIVTCTSKHSRNHEAGFYIGQGMTTEGAIRKVGKTVEGYTTTLSVYNLAKKMGVDMPLVSGAYEILYNNKSPKTIMLDLLSRSPKQEF